MTWPLRTCTRRETAGHRVVDLQAVGKGDRHQIELTEAEAARRNVTIHLVLDLVHVLEHLWAAAWCFHATDDPAAEDWVAVQALAVLAGRTRQVTASLTAQAAQHELTESQQAGVQECVRYLTNHIEYLHYDQALAAGWPIATGVIEGACRHLIGDRLDITGSRWGIEGAEAILRLRAIIDNGDFEAYWAFHLRCEHDRIYQTHDQDRYDLIA